MSAKSKLIGWAIRKKIDEHSDEIAAEIKRIKGMRSVREFREYGSEKGGELKELWRERGPEVKKLLKDEFERIKERQAKKGDK
jgi:gas vesicle protein